MDLQCFGAQEGSRIQSVRDTRVHTQQGLGIQRGGCGNYVLSRITPRQVFEVCQRFDVRPLASTQVDQRGVHESNL